MREIEVKFEITDIKVIKRRIKKIGAKYLGRQSQTDIWFDTSERTEKGKKMRIRLRLHGEEAKLTIKSNTVFGKSFRESEESEVGVSDFDKTREMLTKLGFQEEIIIKKEREVWEIGDVEILLDRVQDLGTFLELEGPKKDIEKVIKKLELEKRKRIIDHYIRLFKKKTSITNKASSRQ